MMKYIGNVCAGRERGREMEKELVKERGRGKEREGSGRDRRREWRNGRGSPVFPCIRINISI